MGFSPAAGFFAGGGWGPQGKPPTAVSAACGRRPRRSRGALRAVASAPPPPAERGGFGRRVLPLPRFTERGRLAFSPFAGRQGAPDGREAAAPCAGWQGALSPVNVPPPEMQHLPANLIELAAQQVAYLPDLPGLHRKAVQLLPDIPQAPADRRRRYPHPLRYGGDGHPFGVTQPGQLLLVRGQAAAAPQLQ